MNFIISEKPTPRGLLIVITDKDVVGKKFQEGNKLLDLTKEFYQGDEKSKEDVRKILRKGYTIHFTGKHAVAIGIEEDLVDTKRIFYVQEVPHAEVYRGE